MCIQAIFYSILSPNITGAIPTNLDGLKVCPSSIHTKEIQAVSVPTKYQLFIL